MKSSQNVMQRSGSEANHTHTHTHTHSKSGVNRYLRYLIVFGFVLLFNQSKAQWTVVSYTDCNITVTIQCPNGKTESSNNYADSWAATWTSPRSRVFSTIPCCSDPYITITFDPIYGRFPITGTLSSLIGTTGWCYNSGTCLPVNAKFIISNPSPCVIVLGVPPGC